jgi:CheY-like chemotaxis protein
MLPAMETPLDALRNALQAGDLEAARAAEEALRKSEANTQLAAEVLHELKQPLLGIKAYAQMLEEDGDRAGERGPASLMLAQVERMEHIIADYARLATNRTAPKERIDLARLVESATKLFKLSPESRLVALELDARPDLELLGNARLIEQLTLNLLNNARDAMGGRGKIRVVATREGDAPILLVADWGPGIPEEIRDKIFEPYVTAKPKGSGLGLAVCRRIAREHGAEITLVPPAAMPVVPPPSTVFKVSFAAPQAQPAKKRLLVVDDEEIIRMVFLDLMGKECEVVQAESAEVALEHLRRGAFDLIITDKNLPGLSGLELAQEARRLDPNSRVILMTGYPSVVTAQQATELGVLDYLLKPFDEIREVREKLRASLSVEPGRPFVATNQRVDVYEDNPVTARQISDALALLGIEANVLIEPKMFGEQPPAGVVMSWDFAPAHGRAAMDLAKAVGRGAPFVVFAEHLTMETALESLRGGAAACLPKLLSDVKALSRELQRALKLKVPAP